MTPTEKTLLAAFVEIGFERAPDCERPHVAYHSGWMLDLAAQVCFDSYRPDFVIGSRVLDERGMPPFKLIVEVDGPEHDSRVYRRTDRARDRFFALNGFIIVRFTNEDVMTDAFGCAEEVMALAIDLQRPNLDSAFMRHLERRGAELLESSPS